MNRRMNMSIKDFLATTDLEHSLLIGYYGGGNFGDELLLETLSLHLHQNGIKQLTIAWQGTVDFETYHHDYGYKRVTLGNKGQLLGAIRRNRTIIIGGGGLWGLDVNTNVFLLSLLLFISRWILGKKVYLLGVGYYNSTSRLGHLSAWLAGKAANQIIARDGETAANFGRGNGHVSQDRDIAWRLEDLDLSDYQDDVAGLTPMLPAQQKALFIAIRRFQPHQHNNYNNLIVDFLDKNQSQPVIISLMEPQSVDPDGYALLQSWQEKYPHITIADFDYNPVALYLWFKANQHQLAVIAPQFHVIVIAQMAGVKFLPVSYDNKVSELLKELAKEQQDDKQSKGQDDSEQSDQPDREPIPINQLDETHIQRFADNFYNLNETVN